MAAQAQQYPVNPGVPGVSPHFWDPTISSYAKISMIYTKGAQYRYEDVVWHAWGEICDLYFPKVAATPTGPRWSIDREAYRGYPPSNPSQIKPDLLAIQLTPGQTQPGQAPQFTARDYLWIECKAASEDKPSGWKNVLAESVTRLSIAHSNRVVFLIIAVGWKCMYFVWDPNGTVQGQPQLFIRPSNNTQPWSVDARIKAVSAAPWVNTVTGEISHAHAMELECWATVLVAGQNVLKNGNSLGIIEQFLVGVQNIALQGQNPALF
ncbi:hypothetical protein K469DRAFT_748511 [Zopfia rhizophila CBS 207.26]|uniref:Uncharacterized protein n=1 Tax=Zopfia rhizophila CBS 207.26 TaxID=1314779 RepID=A0A6A6EAF7_9PEZI|nr:hypothetical protein K469DRAFT_748511 [Zopfia rhizophila CBS 207.26]